VGSGPSPDLDRMASPARDDHVKRVHLRRSRDSASRPPWVSWASARSRKDHPLLLRSMPTKARRVRPRRAAGGPPEDGSRTVRARRRPSPMDLDPSPDSPCRGFLRGQNPPRSRSTAWQPLEAFPSRERAAHRETEVHGGNGLRVAQWSTTGMPWLRPSLARDPAGRQDDVGRE